MKIYASEDHRKHFPVGELYGGKLVRPFECPERWDYIARQLTERGIGDLHPPGPLDFAPVNAIHDANYLDFLRNAWAMWEREGYDGEAIPTVVPARRMRQREPDHIDGKLGYYCMALETAITSGTWHAACSSAAVAITAARSTDAAHAAFGLCRPPGHHAASDLYGGYCFLNNAAIAAQDMLQRGAARVAILDVDFHHGNGTQDIFYQRDDVLFVSLHGRPQDAFPHFLGYADETGDAAGDGFNVNLPMAPGSGFDVWSTALDEGLKAIRTYSPDALVVSLGVDTFESDPISFFKLKSDDFTHYGETIARAGLPTSFIMEGGYAVEEIGINTANVLSGYLQNRGD